MFLIERMKAYKEKDKKNNNPKKPEDDRAYNTPLEAVCLIKNLSP